MGGDPELAHSRTGGSLVAPHGGRHDIPPEKLGEFVGGDFTVRECARGEVPQWPLARDRLVDAVHLHAALVGERTLQGCIRGSAHTAVDRKIR